MFRVISISTVKLDTAVEDRVLGVIRSGIIAQGPVVAEFEKQFAAMHGVNHAIAVTSGTTALVAALQVLDLAPGDEVITSPFTFVATLNAILEAGATARFADIRYDDFNLDPIAAEAQVNERTKVLMPVHLYGQAADMGAFADLAARHDLALVEDAAQAHGATFEGRSVGSFGLGCFSFYATKNLTTGEGGMVTTDDDRLASLLRVSRNQGMRQRYQYEMAGHNYRMTDLQAAVGLPQLPHYQEQIARREANAAALSALLADVDGLVLPRELPGRTHVWHQYTVLVPQDRASERDAIADQLREAGVMTGAYYPRPVYDYDCYQGRDDVMISANPVAEDVARRCLSLPVHPALSADDVEAVAAAVSKVLAR